MQARCVCGAVTVDLPGPASIIVACHCLECQRRTGSPFGVGGYYSADDIRASGAVTEFVRPTAAGGMFRTCFCPVCGTTVYWTTSSKPGMVGIAVGAIADPGYPAPNKSAWEDTMHAWAAIDAAAEHFPRSWSR